MPEAFRKLTENDRLANGWHKYVLKCATVPGLSAAMRFVANTNGVWDGTLFPIPKPDSRQLLENALNAKMPAGIKLSLPKNNFFRGKFEARKGFDEATQTFWLWFLISGVK